MRNGIICVAPYACMWFNITELTLLGKLLLGPIRIRVMYTYHGWCITLCLMQGTVRTNLACADRKGTFKFFAFPGGTINKDISPNPIHG